MAESRSRVVAHSITLLAVVVLMIFTAIIFDSPTSVFILAGIAVVGGLVAVDAGRRPER